jgi:hypothetical protein
VTSPDGVLVSRLLAIVWRLRSKCSVWRKIRCGCYPIVRVECGRVSYGETKARLGLDGCQLGAQLKCRWIAPVAKFGLARYLGQEDIERFTVKPA